MSEDTAVAARERLYRDDLGCWAGQASAAGPSAAGADGARASSWWARLRADPARMAAVRDTWRALWSSRLLVLAAGVGTVLTFGFGPKRAVFNPPGVTRGFGALGDLLAAPVARWDSAWYLVIAHYGYRPELGGLTSSRTAFFPLYPLGLRGLSDLGLAPVVAGVALSVAALAFALYGIHRLTTLELPLFMARSGSAGAIDAGAVADAHTRVPRLAVLLSAFAPMAFYLSAVYSESLYLALSVGVFWCARQGRWAWVGVLGALAGATRSTGLLLAVPALIIYLHGPREDRPPDRAKPASLPLLSIRRLRLRYRLRRDVLWLALMPAGMFVYMVHLAQAGGDPLAPFSAQQVWHRHFVGPLAGVADGARAAFAGLRQLLSGQSHHVYFPAAHGSPMVAAEHNVMLFVFLAAAVPALVGVLRRLPLAYGAYVVVALALPLSDPVAYQPLMSLPRFLLVLFPLSMWLAAWLAPRPRLAAATLVVSGLAMAVFVGQFATWHWVA
jgi:hypothetical protein